ncbi:MAG: glycosyltransferase family 39 protein [Pseudomonadota bacterium]
MDQAVSEDKIRPEVQPVKTATQPLSTPSLSTPWIILLCVAWLLPGLFGHGPWKPDEAYTFGLVHHMIQSGDWIVPTLGGEPFIEKPPIFFIVAALFAKLFSGWLPLHDGARIATVFFFTIMCAFIALTQRALNDNRNGNLALLILIGCLGLLPRAHQLITDVALLSGFAMAYYAFAISYKRPLLAGFLLGTGVGLGFMSKGLIAPGALGLTAIALPLVGREWRCRSYFICLSISLLAMLPWLAVWPWLLYQRSPELFHEWFFVQNWGRFFGSAHLSFPNDDRAFYFKLLPWWGWPATPLALFGLWHNRKTNFMRPAILLPLVCLAVIMLVLTAAGEGRELYALPTLIPLVLLATAGENALKYRVTRILQGFWVFIFFALSACGWFSWSLLFFLPLKGVSEKTKAAILPATPLDFRPSTVCIAAGITLLCVAVFYLSRKDDRRPIIHWTASITLLWAMLMTLWLPVIDEKKSYDKMIAELRTVLPPTYNCIASKGLGEPQRALLDYYMGLVTQRVEKGKGGECTLLLVQGTTSSKVPADDGYRKLWEGNRPGDDSERFWLFERGRF